LPSFFAIDIFTFAAAYNAISSIIFRHFRQMPYAVISPLSAEQFRFSFSFQLMPLRCVSLLADAIITSRLIG
jgi:hypothetical protein